MGRRLGAVVLVALALLAVSRVARAERPLTGVIETPFPTPVGTPTADGLAAYNTLYLNRCSTGCTIHVGYSNSKTDSWGIPAQATLTSFPYGDDAWNKVVACVKDVMDPFNIDVVTSNPGSANHWEIMIAGDPTDINPTNTKWKDYGGVAPGDGPCDTYLDNALVFDFAKKWSTSTTSCDDRCINNICATAAQEIGHVWNRMDHVRNAADPMTYYSYARRKYFQDAAAQCGSDCTMGKAGALTCYGDGQSHDCFCGGQTQNSFQTVASLFGETGGTPPIVTITSPTPGQSVQAGLVVTADIDEIGTITRVDLVVDGELAGSYQDPPWNMMAPISLGQGMHHVEVIAHDGHQTSGSATVDVVIGPPCSSDPDCPYETDVCLGGRCVPGPNATGGLGTACTDATQCASQQCASDGTSSFCVELCQPGDCPDGFGCLDTGAENGACWPGYDEGGGCGCQSSRGGPAGMILALFVMVVTCRRRRR